MSGTVLEPSGSMDHSEERFRELFEHASDGIFIADLDGRYTDVNGAGCALLGYARGEIVGKTIVDLIPAEDVPRLAESREQMLRGGVHIADWRLRRKDGTLVPVEVSAKILGDGRWLGFVRDITERREAERRVQRLVNLHAVAADLGQRALSATEATALLDEVVERVARALEVDLTNVLEMLPNGETFLLRAGFGWKEGLVGHATVRAAGTQPELVVRDAQPVVVDDAALERRFTTLPSMLGEKITSTVSVAIPTRQGPWGALAAHTREQRTFSRDEVDFLRAVANVLGAFIERRRTEEALRESEDTLNRAQAVAHVGSWHLDVKNNRLTWSDESHRIFGVPKGTPLSYQTFLSTVPEEERDRVDDAWTAALHGAPYDIEHRCIVGGQVRWLRERAEVSLDADGRAIEGIGTVQDVTERRLAEDERRRWAETLDAIITTSGDALISIDREQRIQIFNPAAERIFGWKREEVLGRPIDLLLPPRLRAKHRAEVAAFAEQPPSTRTMGDGRMPVVGLRKDGEEFPAEAGISKVETSSTVLLNVSLRDVTSREYAEQEQRFLAHMGEVLMTARRDYEATLDGITRAAVQWFADMCAVDVVDAEGGLRRMKMAHADPAKAAITERLGRLELDRSRPNPITQVLESGRPLFTDITPSLLEEVAQSPERLALWKELEPKSTIVVPILGHPQLLGTIAFISSRPFRRYGPRDVQIAERVATLTALAMENARSYDLAQRAIRARDDVLGMVAHDLRGPLNTIVMQASILANDAERAVTQIRKSAGRMNRLVQDMLDVARMEAGPVSVRLASTPAAQLVADAVHAHLGAAAAASIALRAEVSAELPEVRADRDRVLQILDNLIGNAIKFTGEGGTITVAAVANEHEVRFSVTDTGHGMSEEERAHVFDRFWQAKRHDRRGVGLGLSIVKGLVEAHRGRIAVDSAIGRGTTVTFTLPRA